MTTAVQNVLEARVNVSMRLEHLGMRLRQVLIWDTAHPEPIGDVLHLTRKTTKIAAYVWKRNLVWTMAAWNRVECAWTWKMFIWGAICSQWILWIWPKTWVMTCAGKTKNLLTSPVAGVTRRKMTNTGFYGKTTVLIMIIIWQTWLLLIYVFWFVSFFK